jgi:TRAP-type C4-dicarboxylate transport system substrate-binding protein
MILSKLKLLLGAIALTAISVSVTFSADVKLKLAGTYPVKHFGHGHISTMVDEINNAGVGLNVKYFPASQLGSGEELVEDAIRGNVDMVHAFVYAQSDPRLEVMNLPAMFPTFESMKAAYGDENSPINRALSMILKDLGLVYLANIGEGQIGIVASKKPKDYTGFGDKGMNIRVWSSEVAKMTTESLGYRTTTMNWAEVFAAVQSGVVDGAICCTAEWAYTTFAAAGVGKYYIPVNTNIEASTLYGSAKTWAKLNDAQKKVIKTASVKAANAILGSAYERNEGFLTQLKDAGWEILDFTDAERAAMTAHIKKNVWPSLEATIGKETLDMVMN